MNATEFGRGWRSARLAAVVVLGCSTLAACGSGSTAGAADPPASISTPASQPAPQKPAGPPSVSIKNYVATPATVTVSTGGNVNVTNLDSNSHNLEDKTDRLYPGDVPGKGGTLQITAPANPGTYVFFDRDHPSLKLTMKVAG